MVVDIKTGDRARQDVPARARAPVAAPRRPALRRAADRARRLHRVAFVFGRVAARRLERDRPHRRAPRRRRGLDVPARRGGDRRRARSARTDRRLLRVEGRHARAARRRRIRASCRSWRCCASRARPARPDLVRLVVSVRSPDDLFYADELAGTGDDASSTRARRRPAIARAAGPAHRATTSRRSSSPDATAYVCGSSGFADAASHLARRPRRARSHRVRVERFGPTA